jgi:hypothetical protein
MVMKDELKAQLDEAFAASDAKASQTRARQDQEAEQQAAFMRDFEKARGEVLVPALQEFADYIRSHGWQAALSQPDERPSEQDSRGRVTTPASHAGVVLTFTRDGQKTQGYANHQLPQFSIYCDKAKRDVWFHESTMGPGHGGSGGSSGRAQLAELTPDVMQQRAVTYFKKLMKDAGVL